MGPNVHYAHEPRSFGCASKVGQVLEHSLCGELHIEVMHCRVLYCQFDHDNAFQTKLLHLNTLTCNDSLVLTLASAFLQGLLENPPPSDNPHNIIVCGDDQDAVTDAKQLIDCQTGFKVSV